MLLVFHIFITTSAYSTHIGVFLNCYLLTFHTIMIREYQNKRGKTGLKKEVFYLALGIKKLKY